MRKGWMKIPDVQDGDRTPEEQLLAVWPAIREAEGKRVLDLGCAEGLISIEFAKAGAARVLGIDAEDAHLQVARRLGKAYPKLKFKGFNLNKVTHPLEYDIVLCLGIIHKLHKPDKGLRFAARSASELLLLRSGRGSVEGVIRSKHHKGNTCDSAAILKEEGFQLQKVVDGPIGRDEPVEYWLRS